MWHPRRGLPATVLYKLSYLQLRRGMDEYLIETVLAILMNSQEMCILPLVCDRMYCMQYICIQCVCVCVCVCVWREKIYVHV